MTFPALRGFLAARTRATARPVIVRTVWLLGLVSCFTDISSEMISSILPVYLFVHLQLSPVQFGLIDGLYQGVTAVARLASGIVADRWRRYSSWRRSVRALGSMQARAARDWQRVERVRGGPLGRPSGKGIRTAPRDALISLTTRPQDLASAFGVHRAMDTAGVLVGPLLAYWILASLPGRFDAIFVVSFAVALIGIAVLVLLVDDRRGADVERASRVSLDLSRPAAPSSLRLDCCRGGAHELRCRQRRVSLSADSVETWRWRRDHSSAVAGTASAYLVLAARWAGWLIGWDGCECF